MVALWIPLAWLLTFFLLLGVPWIDRARHDSPHHCAERISNKQRFRYIFKLWPYTVPLFWVYAAEYLPLDGASKRLDNGSSRGSNRASGRPWASR